MNNIINALKTNVKRRLESPKYTEQTATEIAADLHRVQKEIEQLLKLVGTIKETNK